MSLRELRRHVGRLAIVGFEGLSVPTELRRLVAEFDLAGVIYFARNVAEPAQLAELSREVADLATDWPFWISVDQEGGRVARLRAPFTEWPPAMTLGRSGDEKLASRFARALAAELAAVGINLDFAPVLDILTNPDNPAIGDRALATEAEAVARLGAVLIDELQSAGIAACGKHFPGHGDTSVDSHDVLPVVEQGRRDLEVRELIPFRRAIEAGVASMMTAHLLIPDIDEERPASLSPAITQGWLKDELGFPGVVMSDDMGMKALAGPLPESAVAAVGAGCDVLLLCNSTIDEQAAALEALIHAAEREELPMRRIEDAFRRQREAKAAIRPRPERPAPSLADVGCAAHQAVAREMAAWL